MRQLQYFTLLLPLGRRANETRPEDQSIEDMAVAYILFGFVLVVVLAAAIVYYYSKKRHEKLEEPKYNMLKDDDD